MFKIIIAGLLMLSLMMMGVFYMFVLNRDDGTEHTASLVAVKEFYVSPDGNDDGPGTKAKPFKTIEKARDSVRQINDDMAGDIVVYLRGGTFTLSDTLKFDNRDSGTNGFQIIYRNYPGEQPVISGGREITGWVLHDKDKNIYKAEVGPLETRQLFVNGVRAVRARSEEGLPGAEKTKTGHTTTDTSMQNWGNISDIEFAYNMHWTHSRVGVAGISGNTITMKEPAWSGATKKPYGVNVENLIFIENAYELLDQPGEWYLDRAKDVLYYMPQKDENLSACKVIAGQLETLLLAEGTLNNPIENMIFQGITFSYNTWLRPNECFGFPEVQANFCMPPSTTDINADNWVKTPGAVIFRAAKSIRLERNTFVHLGSAGLDFENGSQDNVICGNVFTDISGSGIQIAGINDYKIKDTKALCKNISVINNYIHQCGQDYKGAVGVWVGYAEKISIEHNEICNLPYSGISVGWGWGSHDPSPCKDNKIRYNNIHNVINYADDGAGIYTLSAQPGTEITDNLIHDIYRRAGNYPIAGIYHDNKSRYVTTTRNMIFNIAENRFIHQNDNLEPMYIKDNYIRVKPGDSNYPTELFNNAGIQKEYIDILPNPMEHKNMSQEKMGSQISMDIYEAVDKAIGEARVNRAMNKPATALYTDGSKAKTHKGCEAENTVDGDLFTYAQATGQYKWIFQVDLQETYEVSDIVVKFPASPYHPQALFATEFFIKTSADGVSWYTVEKVTGFEGAVKHSSFDSVKARFVRVQAVKPDGPDQPGGQMAIVELEVY